MAILLLAGLIYLPIFLRSFLCPRHAHVLNVYFGVPGSGKTTFAAYLTRWALHENALIRFCRRHGNPLTRLILNSKYLKRRISVYSNVPITGAYRLDAKVDIGHYMIEDAKIIIDEAGIEYNNRNYKSFPQEAIYFYKYHRHYRVSVDVFSQSYEDMDVTRLYHLDDALLSARLGYTVTLTVSREGKTVEVPITLTKDNFINYDKI